MSRPVPTAPARALAALVVALVAGILGMHALTLHGTPVAAHEAHAATAGVEAMAMADGHVDHTAAAGAPGTHHGSGGHAEHLLMLCAVMLGGAAIALLGLLLLPAQHPLRPLRALMPAVVVPTLVARVRATGPPPVWEFSVIRC